MATTIPIGARRRRPGSVEVEQRGETGKAQIIDLFAAMKARLPGSQRPEAAAPTTMIASVGAMDKPPETVARVDEGILGHEFMSVLSATRRLAAETSDAERRNLFEEHRTLAMRAHHGEATHAERCHLDLVRWQLDQIRDAEIGSALDFWERIAERQEGLAEQISKFVAHAKVSAKPNRNQRR